MSGGTCGVGFVRTGNVAHMHARAIAQVPGARLVGGFNRTRQKAEEFFDRYGGRAYGSVGAADSINSVNERAYNIAVHQRDQRGHHDSEPIRDQGRNLKTQRLARSRWHHGEHVASGQERLDGRFLARAEPVEPKYTPQHLACGGCLLLQRAHQCRNWEMSTRDQAPAALFNAAAGRNFRTYMP